MGGVFTDLIIYGWNVGAVPRPIIKGPRVSSRSSSPPIAATFTAVWTRARADCLDFLSVNRCALLASPGCLAVTEACSKSRASFLNLR